MEPYLRITNLLAVIIVLCSLRYLVYCSNTEIKYHNIHHEDVSSSKLESVKTLLKTLNKTPLKTISSPDGDIIDCIDMRKQLAFDHPKLKNHKILRAPSWVNLSSPKAIIEDTKVNDAWGTQLWHANGTECPTDTIPVRRITADEVLRAPSFDLFGKKFRHRNVDFYEPAFTAKHEYAAAGFEVNTAKQRRFYGTEATINVWKPYVEKASEFSNSQIWLFAGSSGDNNLNTIEAGWQVYPHKYGDQNPRLFIYYYANATTKYKTESGCYNLDCSGFVQTNNKIVIGGAISSVSYEFGRMHEITLSVLLDTSQGNWWLYYDKTPLGYWPTSLFTSLSKYATSVIWGGEVLNQPNSRRLHTATFMGSGKFAEEGYGKASYFRGLKVVDSAGKLESADVLLGESRELTLEWKPNCYDIKKYSNSTWGYYFYYGGPGRNVNCFDG